MKPCRYLPLASFSGGQNMAIDEMLMNSAASGDSRPCLRFYQWCEPTLSLGYFQRLAQRDIHPASHKCPVVRRSTGGGAILHDHELTYSFTTATDDRSKANVGHFYDVFHESLVAVLAEFGVAAQLCKVALPEPKFLCFQRRARGDVLVDGEKIGGSAQRRHQQRLLQHGSVLLQRSSAAPELDGIKQLTDVHICPDDLADRWAIRLADRLGLYLERSALDDSELCEIPEIERSRYGSSQWTGRR